MLFFRSEEHARAWCEAGGHPLRPLVTIDQLWRLSTQWYGTRLQANPRRPTPAEMVDIFSGIGLDGPFWDPTTDLFD